MSHPDFDQWSGDEPDPYRDGPPLPIYYRCLAPGCDWVGQALGAFDHHTGQGHHAIILRDAPQFGPIHFACCPIPREDRAR
jgi:hypothetical protein